MKHLVFCALQNNRIKPACIDDGFFMFFFPRGLLSWMLGVPAIQLIVNHDGQRPTTHPVGLSIENDAHYCMHSYIKTSISGPALQEAYHKAFLRVGGNWRTVESNMKATSLLMQQSSWPYCQLQPPCSLQ